MTYFKIDDLKKTNLKEFIKLKHESANCSIVLKTVIISVCFVLIIQMAFYYTNYVPIKLVYGENPDIVQAVKMEQPAGATQLLETYDSLVNNKFPYPIHFVEKLNAGPGIIYDGIVISKNSKPDDLKLNKWGKPNNLNLYDLPGPNKNISLFNIDGNSFGGPAGFESTSLKYADRYISLNFGSIYKYPETAQLSIQLEIVGELGEYHLIFVNGRLGSEGWVENTLYKKITSNSSQLLDLDELISSRADKFLYLDKIFINIEKGTDIVSFPFRIDLGKSTINTPDTVEDGAPFFVNGFVFQEKVASNDIKYRFDDWEYIQILNQHFIADPSDSYIIAENNWEIKNIIKSIDNLTNTLHINLISEKNIPLWDLSILNVIPHLDLHNSLLQFGSPKDILFVAVLLLLITLAFYKTKSFSEHN